MDCAASITPPSTSLMEDSTIRAINGAEPITSGTMVAVEPRDVPTIAFVTGVSATSRIRNGALRKRLITTPSTRLSTFMGRMPSLSLTTSRTPSGRPMR